MATLVETCLPIFENARVLLADLGFRQHDVLMRVVSWSGETSGEGTKTVVDSPLLIQGRRVKARLMKQEDILASGGQYEDGDYKIGPFTPAYTGAVDPTFPDGGIEVEGFNPLVLGTTTETYYRITGPGMPGPAGAWFKKIGQTVDTNFSRYFVARKTATGEP